jgi:arylsulfatase A-like enzyme
LTPRRILGTTGLGRWLVENLRNPRDYYSVKWIRSQSRNADEINRSFLTWLYRDRDVSRPFFAFLNYLDAHEPFLAPEDTAVPFGLRPGSRGDRRMLLEYWDQDKFKLSGRDVELVRDSYDHCIAALDRRIGSLLDDLDRRGVLRNTLVIVTSDHGEQFGEHGVFNHGFSLYANEVHIPLLIIDPAAPSGRTVSEPVSLRDLPATVADLVGLGAKSPFPGRSLAASWRSDSRAIDASAPTTLSEADIPMVIIPQRGRGPAQRGFTVSLVGVGLHYLLDTQGTEELYDVAADPGELHDVKGEPARQTALRMLRDQLAWILRSERVTGGVVAAYREQLLRALNAMALRPSI